MKRRILFLSLLTFMAIGARSAMAATITVNNTADVTANDGNCTLREAIIAANTDTASGAAVGECAAGAGTDTINFNISGAGVHTISPSSALPEITQPVIINGYSQPGTSENTLANGDNAVILIEIDGSSTIGNAPGLALSGGSNTVKGLAVRGFKGGGINGEGYGIYLKTSGVNTIQGNFIGTDAAGTTAHGNACAGVALEGILGNVIGGATPAARNVISGSISPGCAIGISLTGASNNQIQGNFIGTDKNGTAALGNGTGIVLTSLSNNNVIGGTAAGTRNLISGNSTHGIQFAFSGSNTNDIQGNLIGTDVSGTLNLGNGGDGIRVSSANSTNNTIGGTTPGAGNVIAFNTGNGVGISNDATEVSNAIQGNSIFSNSGLGIDLALNGLTANDAGDPDTGPNNLQNFPMITSVTSSGGTTTVQGTLNSTPSTSGYRIEFFSNDACDGSGNGEGQTFLGAKTGVDTDGSGNASFTATLTASVASGKRITATATAPGNDTSEFSQCFTYVPACGNGVVEAGEGCDDANAVNDDGCTNACTLPNCGDGIVQSGEQCDDANSDDTDACTHLCAYATCGDGFVEASGEQCDDGNTTDGDGCNSLCGNEVTGTDELAQTNPTVDFGNVPENSTITLDAPDPRSAAASALTLKNASSLPGTCSCAWTIDPSTLGAYNDAAACETNLTAGTAGTGTVAVTVNCGTEGTGSYSQALTVQAASSAGGGDGNRSGTGGSGGCSLVR